MQTCLEIGTQVACDLFALPKLHTLPPRAAEQTGYLDISLAQDASIYTVLN